MADIGRPGSGDSSSRMSVTAGGMFLYFVLGLLAAAVSYGLPLAMGSSLTVTAAVFTSVLVPSLMTICLVKVNVKAFAIFWVSLALMQNFFSGVWAARTATVIPEYVTEQKTVSILCACLVSIESLFVFLAKRPRLAAALGVYALALILALGSLESSALAYGRNFTVPVLLILLFAALTENWDLRERLRLVTAIAQLVTLLLAAGLGMEVMVGTDTWRSWLRADINGALNSLSDATSIFGLQLTRYAGFVIEPTNAGYIAASAIMISVATWAIGRKKDVSIPNPIFIAVPAAICLIASGAKSGFLMLFIATLSAVIFRSVRSIAVGMVLAWVSAFVVVLGYVAKVKGPSTAAEVFANPLAILGGDSTTFHLAGLVSGIKSTITDPLGAGLGVGGNFSRVKTESWEVWIGSGSESAWGVLSYQLGLLGLLSFAFLLIVLGRHLGTVSAALICAWSSAALFAEAIFGPQVAGALAISVALLAVPPNSDHSVADSRFSLGKSTK
ncbi:MULTISPECIES: hypothetical protein [Actinomycetes]|uniref:hypothetical protein n=1 Tax=Actinomycetes TaxID=1760 RepID=UPI0012DBD2CD|nr:MULTISPECIES: hypothetical protein [Actinomycetes]